VALVRVTYLMRCLGMMRGGGETQHLAWMRALKGMGVEIDVISGRPLLTGALYPPEPDLDTVTLRSPYLRNIVYEVQSIRGFGRLSMWSLHYDEEIFCKMAFKHIAAQPRQPDLVLAHALHQAPRFSTGAWPVAVYLPGAPHPRYIPDLRRADALISDGWAARELPAMIGKAVDNVPKGVDIKVFKPEGNNLRAINKLSGTKVVLCVSRLVPIKNLPMLLRAFAIVRRSDPSVRLVLVGEGPQQMELEAKAKALGITEAVTFAGYVPQNATADWYRSADIFALTSDFDNSPNVVLEAMASGLPIVATDVGGLRDYVTSPENGTLTPKGDESAFAEALLALLRDPIRAKAMCDYNRTTAIRQFSWTASASEMLSVYRRIVDDFARRKPAAVAS
jgi:glycosyltransferase involved in cell wall biosynthesis